jgi:septal ring factor EnvC (AmiA/AmiB activator)
MMNTGLVLVLLALITVCLVVAVAFFFVQRSLLRNAEQQEKKLEESITELKHIRGEVVQQVKELNSQVVQLQQESGRLAEEIGRQRLQLQFQGDSYQQVNQRIGQLNDFLYGTPQGREGMGQQIVREQLRLLPAEWVAQRVRLAGDEEVAFALRAPNGKFLPIESAWTAEHLLGQLNQAMDVATQNRLRKEICREVMQRAIEARRYLEPRRTLGFAIAAVPDGVFETCGHIQPVLAARDVILVSYSLLVPYVLLVVHTMLASVEAAEAAEVAHVMHRTQLQVDGMAQELDKMNPIINAIGNLLQTDAGVNVKLATAQDQMRVIEEQLAEVQAHLPNRGNLHYVGDLAALRTDLQGRLARMRVGLGGMRGTTN